jgi:hypothetical protein
MLRCDKANGENAVCLAPSPLEDGAAVRCRQIKNVLKTAQMLARRANGHGKVDMGHIETILAIERGKEFAKA